MISFPFWAKVLGLIVMIVLIIILVADSIIKHKNKNKSPEELLKNKVYSKGLIRGWYVQNMRNDIKTFGITKEELFDD